MSSDNDGKDKGKDNVVPLPGVKIGGGAADVSIEAVRALSNNLQVILEYQQVSSKMHYNKYCLLLKEGFNEAQALELCKTLP